VAAAISLIDAAAGDPSARCSRDGDRDAPHGPIAGKIDGGDRDRPGSGVRRQPVNDVAAA
jgi:hypothetical protein